MRSDLTNADNACEESLETELHELAAEVVRSLQSPDELVESALTGEGCRLRPQLAWWRSEGSLYFAGVSAAPLAWEN